MQYHWTFLPVFQNAGLLWAGALGTMELVVLSLLLALPIGLLLALIRIARVPVFSTLATVYVECFRSAPSIILIYWCYFALPVLANVTFSPLTAAVLAVGLQSASFFCEVFRAGIAAIPRGQWEASRALGMRSHVVFWTIVLPQAIRHIVPAFLNRLIDLVKTTALAATIAYSDIVYSAMQISSKTYRPIETFSVLGSIFFVALFAMSFAARRYEQHVRRVEV
ncbi:amino acid ABC transporter permease [Paraburkholderia tropica]|uniref:amino acid ABC transporter permease n=1 Tax=Paraburkholderia tropica TaxID=92647 RepID=UPI002AB75483|nr:amino acid ABC transporter permease [Paraburkholderia tropica]